MAQADEADLALWKSVGRDNLPAAYGIDLQAFPTGKFAALARIRSQTAAPGAVTVAADPGPGANADAIPTLWGAGASGTILLNRCTLR